MDKNSFYLKLHADLAEKYNTDTWTIEYIRSCFCYKNLSREQMINRQLVKISRLKRELHNTERKIERRKLKTPVWVKKYPETADKTIKKTENLIASLPRIKRGIEKRSEIEHVLLSINDNQFEEVVKIYFL